MSDPDLCIHCKSFWRVGHSGSCPQVTNLWPVTEAEVAIVCADCRGNLGDAYTVVDGCIVCLGCAAMAMCGAR